MPNMLAYLVLFTWPLVVWAMYARMPVERAFVWTIIGGYLFMPPGTSVNLPLLPPLDKFTVTSLSALFFTVTVGRRKVALLPRSWIARALMLIFVSGAIPSVLTNPDPIVISIFNNPTYRIIPGQTVRDVFSFVSLLGFGMIPFLLGRELLGSDAGRRELLRGMVFAGLVYTLPSLFEIRMSPQLNVWIYGFFQHDFIQMMRDGGFRPIVFMPHALVLAIFFVSSAMAAASLSRSEPAKLRGRYALAAVYLMGVIVLCKSMASIVYMSLLVPIVFVMFDRARLRIAVLFVLVALAYPAMRNSGLIPLDNLVDTAASYSADRAQSLQFRFDNEEMLLAHAHERPLFGWGGWGRNLLYDEWTGRSITITDGQWIIVLGMFGLMGFVGMFGLLSSTVLLAWRRMRKLPKGTTAAGVGTLALIVGINMLDMLINAPLYPSLWMIAGAVLGFAEAPATESAPVARPGDTPRMAPRTGRRADLGAEQPVSGPRTVL